MLQQFGMITQRKMLDNNYQFLDETEQDIVICRWREDQLFADAEGRGQ